MGMAVGKKCKISAQYFQNYDDTAKLNKKKNRDIDCATQDQLLFLYPGNNYTWHFSHICISGSRPDWLRVTILSVKIFNCSGSDICHF